MAASWPELAQELTPGRRRRAGRRYLAQRCRCPPGGAPRCGVTGRCCRPPWPAQVGQQHSRAPRPCCLRTACWHRCHAGWGATGWRRPPAAPARPWQPAGDTRQRGMRESEWRGLESVASRCQDARSRTMQRQQHARQHAWQQHTSSTLRQQGCTAHLAAAPGGSHEAPTAQQRQHESQAAHDRPGHPAAAGSGVEQRGERQVAPLPRSRCTTAALLAGIHLAATV